MFFRGRTLFVPCLGDADTHAPQIGQSPPYAQNPSIANKQNKNYTSVFRQRTDFTHARHTFFSGRADNACTNLLGFFV